MNKVFLKLTEKDFKDLVAGREIVLEASGGILKAEIHMILEDMGWGRMVCAITDAMNETNKEKK